MLHSSSGDAPILVIGNGPVGQSTALLLARWGVPTIVLDARERRDLVGSKAIVQQRDVLDVWDALDGAGREIADAGLTWVRARTFYRDAELFCLEYADSGRSAFPPFVNISQSATEAILDAKIAAEPLIEVRWSHRVTGLDQDDAGVVASCETSDGEQAVRGTFAVVCAGSRAESLRALLGIGFEGRSFGDQFLICDIRTRLDGWEQERRFYFDPPWNPGRQVLIHPSPDSTFRIDWQVPEGFDLASEEANGGLEARIRQIIGERDYEIVWKSVYRFQQRIADRFRVGRVLFAGDAAHLVSPFGARGLNSGVQDAENAAWKLAFVHRGLAPEELLESYHAERGAAARENLEITGATMDFLVPQTEEQARWRRDVLDRARVHLGAGRRVDAGRLAEPFWYDASPLTTPSPKRPCGGRPAKGTAPDLAPGVLVPDHPIAGGRLRALLRGGLTLLCGDEIDPAEVSAAIAGEVPAAVHRLSDLDPAAPAALGLAADEVWLVRPDAHLAAALATPGQAALSAAFRRMIAL